MSLSGDFFQNEIFGLEIAVNDSIVVHEFESAS